MQACLGLGIDYKELLPKHYENKIQSKSLNEEQRQVQDRMMELKRKRRVIQVANRIQQDRFNSYYAGRNRSAKQLKSKIG